MKTGSERHIFTRSGIKLKNGKIHGKQDAKEGWFVGWWNNEKCHCRVVMAKLIDGESKFPFAWWRPFVGEVLQVIEVVYDKETFCLANEDGSGFMKISIGRGLPSSGHATVEFYEVIEVVTDSKKWVKEFSFEKSAEWAERGELYWQFTDFEHYERIKAMREIMTIDFKDKEKKMKTIDIGAAVSSLKKKIVPNKTAIAKRMKLDGKKEIDIRDLSE